MESKKKVFRVSSFLMICLFIVITAHILSSREVPAAPSTSQPAPTSDKGWPRQIANGGTTFEIYQPQLEKWEENRLSARAAVAIGTPGSDQKKYGVVWVSARTEVDKVNRQVTLDALKIDKASFPSTPEKNQEYGSLIEKHYTGRSLIISLDRLETGLAYSDAAGKSKGVAVKNDPPHVFYSATPAILILIDGQPAPQPFPDTKLQRVINTRALIMSDPEKKKYYLHLYDGWMEANVVTGPWKYAGKTSKDMKKAEDWAASSRLVDLMRTNETKAAPSLKVVAEKNTIPNLLVSLEPAELIQSKGELKLQSIEGTQLLYATNTENHIFIFSPTNDYYVLLSGRWFHSPKMEGPWAYAAASQLPEDFKKIPEEHSQACVLTSIPGTPQAKEALIANSIPQTAVIKRSEAKLNVQYDGAPQFRPIEGSSLEYAANSPTPVVKVNEGAYYAVQNGVWFTAAASRGPWEVTGTVPAEIYSIPPSCPIHYVTYVKVYNSTAETVDVGYTPGYYGTVVSNDEVVVYGTGYYYSPYVGTVWYGAPYTYGCGVAFGWSTGSGWSVSYAVGYGYPMYYPWWGPVGWGYMYAPYPYYPMGYWGGAAYTNVYGHWGNTAFSRTNAAWANPYTGNVGSAGRGAAYNSATGSFAAGRAGHNTNVYTGNTVAGAQGIRYNANTGVVAGGAVVGAGNAYTGEGAVAGRGFAYDTDTGNAIAAGKNNVFASKDGEIYRYDKETGNVSQRNPQGEWADKGSLNSAGAMSNKDFDSLRGQVQGRSMGEHRSGAYNSYRGGGGGVNRGGGGGRRR
jgi:hypothetical protein